MDVENLTEGSSPTDRWIRLPVRGNSPDCGLTRSFLYRLIEAGVIKSANIRQPGQIRGIRLIWLPSVLSYIEKHADRAAR